MRKRSHSLLLLKIISPHYLPAGIPVKILKIRTKNVLAIKIFSVGLTYIIGYLPMALYYCITSFRFLTAEVRLSKMSCFSESKKKFFFFSISWTEMDHWTKLKWILTKISWPFRVKWILEWLPPVSSCGE